MYFVILAVAVLVFALLYVFKQPPSWVSSQGIPIPKSGRGWFGVFGHFTAERTIPFFKQACRECGPLWYVPLGAFRILRSTQTVVLTQPDEARRILTKHPDKSANFDMVRLIMGDNLFATRITSPRFRHTRKFATTAFNPSLLASVYPSLFAPLQDLIDELQAHPQTNADKLMGRVAIDILAASTLGMAVLIGIKLGSITASNSPLEVASESVMEMVSQAIRKPLAKYFGESIPRGRAAWQAIRRFSEQALETVQKDPNATMSLTHTYLDALKAGELTKEEVLQDLSIIVLAGHETSSHSMAYICYHLAYYPEECEKARQEVDAAMGDKTIPTYEALEKMEYLQCFIMESMRMLPSVGGGPTRSLSCDETICGYTIPKGSNVMVSVPGVNYQPSVWQDPDKFNPSRFKDPDASQKVFTFSHGIRNCVGQNLAKIELRAVTATLLRNFTWEFVDPKAELIQHHAITAKPKDGVQLKFKARN